MQNRRTVRLTRSLAADIALAVASIAIGLIGTPRGDAWDTVPDRPIDAAGYAIIVAAGLSLVVRRRWPPVTLLAATVLVSGYLAVGYPYGAIFFSLFVAIYSVARYLPIRPAMAYSAVALLLLLVHLFTNSLALSGFLGLIPATAWVVVPFAIGTTLRLFQESEENERKRVMQRHADDERLRLAQEVHDVVGHGLAAIKMQSDVALHLIRKKPEHAEAALETISRTSGEALDELRSTLDLVRKATAERAPTGLGRLEELRQRMTEAGMQVAVTIVGEPARIPPPADLAGYRILQESLTNVLKHSAAKVADVRVEYAADGVTITVSNPAADVVITEGGWGLSGMRDRVTSLGGEFTAGPTDDGRFEVQATIPTGR